MASIEPHAPYDTRGPPVSWAAPRRVCHIESCPSRREVPGPRLLLPATLLPEGPGSYEKWILQQQNDRPLTRLCNPTLELTDRMATAGEDSGLGRRQKTRQKSPVRHKMVSLGDLTREAMLQVSPSLRAATHLAVTPFPDLITDSTLRTTFLWPFERVRCLLFGTPH